MRQTGRRGVGLVGGAAAWLLLTPGSAGAESALRLPYPESFGSIPAATYDSNYQRVGDATVLVEERAGDQVRVRVESGIDGGAHTIATADLLRVDGGAYLQLLRQESRSTDGDGIAMGVLSIDHVSGIASCDQTDGGEMKTERLTLPAQDRVANVPLNLLFQPLVEGSTDAVTFQLLLCRFGARLVDIDAHVVSRKAQGSAGDAIVEVEYTPNFGRFVSALASQWMPKLSIWFDPRIANSWIAHRVPLYSKGPEVFVIRDGLVGSALARFN